MTDAEIEAEIRQAISGACPKLKHYELRESNSGPPPASVFRRVIDLGVFQVDVSFNRGENVSSDLIRSVTLGSLDQLGHCVHDVLRPILKEFCIEFPTVERIHQEFGDDGVRVLHSAIKS